MKKLNTYITEKLVINKDTKDEIDNLLFKEGENIMAIHIEAIPVGKSFEINESIYGPFKVTGLRKTNYGPGYDYYHLSFDATNGKRYIRDININRKGYMQQLRSTPALEDERTVYLNKESALDFLNNTFNMDLKELIEKYFDDEDNKFNKKYKLHHTFQIEDVNYIKKRI